MFNLDPQTEANSNGTNPKSTTTSARYFSQAKCPLGNICQSVCVYKNCTQNAIVCGVQQCDCKKSHKKICTWIDPQVLLKIIEKKPISNEQLIRHTEEKFDKLFDEISVLREEIMERLLSMQTVDKKLFNDVSNYRFDGLNGKMIHKVIEILDVDKNEDGDGQQITENNLFLFEMIDQKWKQVHQSILNRELSKLQKMFNSLTFQELNKIEPFDKPIFESNIITNNVKQTKLFCLFEENKQPKALNLLYRASENNFQVKKFWQKCNGYGDTLVLIRTSTNKIIGGFSPLCWMNGMNGKWETDESGESFLFSVTEDLRFGLKGHEKHRAVRYNVEWGPHFGFGNDLKLADKANENKKSFAFIGYSYGNDECHYNDERTWEKFTGEKEDYHFSTIEWEVYEVEFEQ